MDRVDLAVRIGALPDSSLFATRIGAIRRIVCGSPGYFAQRGVPQSPRELSGHDCVTFEGLMAEDRWVFPSGKSEITVPIHSRLIVTTAEAAVDAAVAGVGLTRVLSYQAAGALRAGSLALALEEFEPASWPVNLVYPGGRMLPLKLRAFFDFAAPRLKMALSDSSGSSRLGR
jgi:DNA-binding transcriptional LysR family regulator